MEKVTSKCGCEFDNNKALVDKVRSKGCANDPMPTRAEINCDCGHSFTMTTLVDKCPNCQMTYGITPCSADDHQYIVKAGINY